MSRKPLLAVGISAVALATGLFLWVRSVFTEDAVRAALAQQLSSALGEPVTVGGISAGIYPRVTVNLKEVTIGEPARIRVRTLHVGASLGALFSRRIEHARLELSGARVQLPLPSFASAPAAPSVPSRKAPVELVSIDAVVLRDVEVVSGGRTVIGDVELLSDGNGVVLRKMRLRADNTRIDVTGNITDVTGPVGTVAVTAATLNIDQLVAFANAFATATGVATMPGRSAATPRKTSTEARHAGTPMNIAMSITAERATIGTLSLEKLSGKARITNDTMRLEPLGFGVFGGHYDGSLVFNLTETPGFALKAAVAGVDVARATAFAGQPGTISGTLAGRLNVTGTGLSAASVRQSTHGNARLDIVNGVVRNLGLARSIVVATSGRTDAPTAGASQRDESFTRLGTTLTIAGGSASTADLRFESPDVLFGASGTLRLDGTAVNLSGRAQLSDELSQHAGRDLVRYTQEGGRVTLPVTITGSADAPHVRIDIVDAAKRAAINRAAEETQKALKKTLSDLFKR